MSSSRARKSSRIKRADAARRITAPLAEAARGVPEVVLGRLTGIDDDGRPLVEFLGNAAGRPLAALTTASVGPEAVGRDVALLFVDGDKSRPLLVGVVQQQTPDAPAGDAEHAEARVDGRRVVITGRDEVVLKCGKASITLTRAGKVLIRGAYLLNRSSGVNRIKGGSVQIN